MNDNLDYFKHIAELNHEAGLNNSLPRFDRYFLDLAILDHIREIQLIDNEIKRIKNQIHQDIRLESLKRHKELELADLYILLRKYFENKLEAIIERENKFINKSKEDTNV